MQYRNQHLPKTIFARHTGTCDCGTATYQRLQLGARNVPVCSDCLDFVRFNATRGDDTMHFVRRDDAWGIWLAPEAYTAFAALCDTLGMPL
jgi:hypothetical protein